jgi:hypothetical protein
VAGLDVGGVDPDIGAFQQPIAEALDSLVELLAEPAHLPLADAVHIACERALTPL